MKKSILFVLVIITAMLLSMGLFAFNISAAPEATPAPAPEAQAPEAQAPQAPQTLMNTKINFDGSAVTTYKMEVDPSLIEKMPNFVETITKQVEKSGYTVELLDTDGKKVLVLTKVIKKGEKLTFAPPGQDTEDFDFVVIKGFFSTMYIASARFDMRGYPESQELMKFSFEAPIKPKYSNAQVQEKGGALSLWSVVGGSANPINYVVTVPNVINIVIVLLILLILIFVVYMIILSNKKKAMADLSEEEYGVDDDLVAVDSEEDPYTEMTQEEIDADIEETDKKDKE